MPSVLFVCLGNICRSPLAEGLFRHQVRRVHRGHEYTIASAGTGGWHEGDPPDHRSIAIAAQNGVDIAQQRAQKLRLTHFEECDLILAMDRQNLKDIKALAPSGSRADIAFYLDYTLGQSKDVPDPYYGQNKDFALVYDLCAKASLALLTNWQT